MKTASAPGKLILCGEHAVVYGQPAIAIPVHDVRAYADVGLSTASGIHFVAPDLEEEWSLLSAPDHPLSRLTQAVLQALGSPPQPALHIRLRSDIPIASGMGSGAALGAALVQALAHHYNQTLSPAQVAALVFESERIYHGTPSGIDNTVVSFGTPIWFERRAEGPLIEILKLGHPLSLVIGDTGVRAATKGTVGRVRERWLADPHASNQTFEAIGDIVHQVRQALAAGDLSLLGGLLNRNQTLLAALGVSSGELERLIMAARGAGAWGAKLAGGGGGGVMFALVDPQQVELVRTALLTAGAVQVWATKVNPL